MVFLTKLKPEPMGAHSLSVAYGVNSLVMSGDGAAAYISVKDVPAGTPLTNTDYWRLHTDLTAVRQSAEAAAQKANAARDEMLEIARNLTDAVERSGNPVQAELVGGLPFDRVETILSPKQSGSGDPSPDNIRKITGWTGAGMIRCGKNLCDSTLVQGSRGADGIFVSGTTSNITVPDLIPVAPGMVLYVNTSKGAFVSGEAWRHYFYDSSQALISTALLSTDINWVSVPDGAAYFAFQVGGDSYEKLIGAALMLTDGGMMPYEPYQGDTYAADFGQTVYGGTLDWLTGVLTVEWAMVALTGAETYNNYSSWKNPGCCVVDAIPGAVRVSGYGIIADLVCTHAPIDTVDKITSTSGDIAVGQGYANLYISLGTEDKASLVDYITSQYAAGTPVQVCYKLATPTTIQLTPQELRQLQGANTLYGDGSIAIAGRANPAIALDARIAALEAAALAE